jgi:hypothetical protein
MHINALTTTFCSPILARNNRTPMTKTSATSISAALTTAAMTALMANTNNAMGAKVHPGSIQSMAVHPSRDHFIAAAGDHMGNIGMWSVKEPSTAASVTAGAIDSSTAFHLVQPHQGLVSCLQLTMLVFVLIRRYRSVGSMRQRSNLRKFSPPTIPILSIAPNWVLEWRTVLLMPTSAVFGCSMRVWTVAAPMKSASLPPLPLAKPCTWTCDPRSVLHFMKH